MKDFFISYTKADQPWAEWIAWQLENDGYTTIIQAWDFHAGSNFVSDMQQAAIATNCTIAVLSPAFLNSPYTEAEWTSAFTKDPTGTQRKLLMVRVKEVEPPGLLKPRVYIDLVGLKEGEASDRLLKQVKGKRGKPDEPPKFPADAPRPNFPGTLTPSWYESLRINLRFIYRKLKKTLTIALIISVLFGAIAIIFIFFFKAPSCPSFKVVNPFLYPNMVAIIKPNRVEDWFSQPLDVEFDGLLLSGAGIPKELEYEFNPKILPVDMLTDDFHTLRFKFAKGCFSSPVNVRYFSSIKVITVAVSKRSGGDFRTINNAISAAIPGSVIKVSPGVYYENVILKPYVKLLGEPDGKSSVIINGSHTGSVIKLSNNSQISGFTITNSGTNDDAKDCGILSEKENCEISYNVIKNNNFGVIAKKSYGLIIRYNVFFNNGSSAILVNGGDFTIYTNFFVGNENGAALYLDSKGNEGTFYNNTISNNKYGIHVNNIDEESSLEIANNIFQSSKISALFGPPILFKNLLHNLFDKNTKNLWDSKNLIEMRMPESNIEGDAGFVDPKSYKFMLKSDSIAIDSGGKPK